MQNDLYKLTAVSLALFGVMVMQTSFGSQPTNADDISLTGLKTRIETPLISESRDFYTKYLGMKVLDSWNEKNDKGVILGLGSSTQSEAYLEIAYVETPKSYEGISLQFRVKEIDSVAKKLRGQLKFRGPEERLWGSTYLYLEDPTGIQVILYEGKL